MTRILCVDDEPRVLSGLRRQLHGEDPSWALLFAESGDQALEMMRGDEIDVLVTDLCMPGMDGARLLARVLDERPRTVRLVLSGHADADRLRAARARAHRCLEKPAPHGLLAENIREALAVREVVEMPGRAGFARLWCTPPDRVPAARPLLPLLFRVGDADAAREVLAEVLADDPRLALRLDAMLLAVGDPGGEAPRRPAAACDLGVIVPLVVSLRLYESFFAPGRAWEEALRDARLAAAAAAERGDAPSACAAAAACGLLLRPGTPSDVGGALAWLLTSWGLPEGSEEDVARALRSDAT